MSDDSYTVVDGQDNEWRIKDAVAIRQRDRRQIFIDDLEKMLGPIRYLDGIGAIWTLKRHQDGYRGGAGVVVVGSTSTPRTENLPKPKPVAPLVTEFPNSTPSVPESYAELMAAQAKFFTALVENRVTMVKYPSDPNRWAVEIRPGR